jgi:hypothetical protein
LLLSNYNKKYDKVPEIRLFEPANLKEFGLQKNEWVFEKILGK